MGQLTDRTFGPGRVDQHQIDDHVVEAHGPESAPRRTSEPPNALEDSDTPNDEFPPLCMDDEITTIGEFEPPPPISTRLGDLFRRN